MTLWLTGDPTADQLLTDDPFALLIGMLLDQQVTMESAFAGPAKIAERMGGLDVHRIAEADPDGVRVAVRDAARGAPLPGLDGRAHPGRRRGARRAVRRRRHAAVDRRRPGRTDRAQAAQGAARVRRPEGPDLPGAPGKADRRAADRVGSRPPVRTASRDRRRSIADVTDPTSLAEVRATKQAAKAAAKASI